MKLLILTVFLFSLNLFAKPVDLAFTIRSRVSMEQLAQDVLNPASDRYQKYYSPEEIRNLAGPSDESYQNTISNLKANGFKILNESKTHLLISVSADESAVQKFLGVQLKWKADSRHHEALSNARLPRSLQLVESVIGLNNTRQNKPRLHIKETTKATRGPNYSTVREMYGFTPIYESGFSGKGQDIAIAGYDDFDIFDVEQYFMQTGIRPGPTVEQVIFNGKPHLQAMSAIETETDAELSGMIAPNAQIHVFGSEHNDDLGEVQLFTAILDDNRAKIVNYSWGDCEDRIEKQHKDEMNEVFARAVAQGVNIFAASGDSGALGCDQPGYPDSRITSPWPSGNPYVVSVGGTTAEEKNGDVHETGWEYSGGGVSTYYPMPSWQMNLGLPGTTRWFPDVAFNADPYSGESVWTHYPDLNPMLLRWIEIGGTSIAAPQWAGFTALVNEARGKNIGFLPPHLYSMPVSDRATTFHDVVQGNNHGYSCAAGWDPVTGWGSMRASGLLNWLLTK